MNKYNTYKKFRFRTDLQYKSKKVNRGKQKMTGHEVVIKSVLTPRSLFRSSECWRQGGTLSPEL